MAEGLADGVAVVVAENVGVGVGAADVGMTVGDDEAAGVGLTLEHADSTKSAGSNTVAVVAKAQRLLSDADVVTSTPNDEASHSTVSRPSGVSRTGTRTDG